MESRLRVLSNSTTNYKNKNEYITKRKRVKVDTNVEEDEE